MDLVPFDPILIDLIPLDFFLVDLIPLDLIPLNQIPICWLDFIPSHIIRASQREQPTSGGTDWLLMLFWYDFCLNDFSEPTYICRNGGNTIDLIVCTKGILEGSMIKIALFDITQHCLIRILRLCYTNVLSHRAQTIRKCNPTVLKKTSLGNKTEYRMPWLNNDHAKFFTLFYWRQELNPWTKAKTLVH